MPEPDLDHLYWHTDLPVATIADTTGVRASGIHRLVTPLDVGLPCYRCGTSVSYTSRSARDSGRPRCASCGCSRHDPAHERGDGRRLRLVPATMGGVVVVHDDGRDLGYPIESCARVLAGVGIAWTGELVRVTEPEYAGPAVVRALAACHEVSVIAVPSLAALGCSQAERLQVLFTLTRMRWRVVSAWDVEVARPRRPLTAYGLDHLADIDDVDDVDGSDDVYDDDVGDVGGVGGPSHGLGLAGELLAATASPVGVRRLGW